MERFSGELEHTGQNLHAEVLLLAVTLTLFVATL